MALRDRNEESETMSTERKPGSRGVTNRSTGDRANQPPKAGAEPEPGARDGEKTKGSTKTVSPRRGFKRKPRK